MGVTVETAAAADLEVSALTPEEALEHSEGRAHVAVALGNGCSHAYVITGSARGMRAAAARFARAVESAVEASESAAQRGR